MSQKLSVFPVEDRLRKEQSEPSSVQYRPYLGPSSSSRPRQISHEMGGVIVQGFYIKITNNKSMLS